MKKIALSTTDSVIIGAALAFAIILLIGFAYLTSGFQMGMLPKAATADDSEIKLAARRASVQVQMYIPAMKVSFTHPLDKDKEFNHGVLTEALAAAEEKLKEYLDGKIKEEIEKGEKPRYENSLTTVEDYAYEPKSKTNIPIGALRGVPKWAKFPERVLVAYKTEKKDIPPYSKDAERDVLAISETTGVSISKAKEMLTRIQSEGYTVSKEEVSESSEVVLLWFSSGWSDTYPSTLSWEVKVEGTDANIISGYSNGILATKPIPDKKKVYVKAGYFDLKSEFKQKSSDVERLEREVDRLKKDKKDLEKKLDKASEKEVKPYKRDIRTATYQDLMYGVIKLEVFWWTSKASGVYLGNTDVRKEMGSWTYRGLSNIEHKKGGFVLTNAHVAAAGLKQEVWISDDNETMYIVGPGYPSIRHTQHSDSFGSPAHLLAVDGAVVYSDDYDCAIYITTAIPGHEKNRAILGDSDQVRDGTRIVMVGNPAGFQKFSTEGIVSNADYPTGNAGEWFRKNIRAFKRSMWIDAPIGAGGTSGSGVWALEGSQAGKVISLHNSGIHTGIMMSEIREDSLAFGRSEGIGMEAEDNFGLIINISQEKKDRLFKKYPYRDAVFNKKYNDIQRKDPDDSLVKMMESKYFAFVRMDGMSAGVPINDVKSYLQERGIDPDIFGFEGVKQNYWVK